MALPLKVLCISHLRAEPQDDVILNYGQTYDVQVWTILPSCDDTLLTNDGTGHGMFVVGTTSFPAPSHSRRGSRGSLSGAAGS
jgi:hypothetical protein